MDDLPNTQQKPLLPFAIPQKLTNSPAFFVFQNKGISFHVGRRKFRHSFNYVTKIK